MPLSDYSHVSVRSDKFYTFALKNRSWTTHGKMLKIILQNFLLENTPKLHNRLCAKLPRFHS